MPNVLSGMSPNASFTKVLRVYEINTLTLSLDTFMWWSMPQSVKSVKLDISYSMSVLSKIIILLHYLSCLWIYVGGPSFMDHEEGQLPWQFANEDFIGMTQYEIYVFSTYWVCTVITTVGYGDYAGGTTIEYQVTLFLELFGMVVFAALQMAVTRLIDSKYHFDNYINEKEAEIDMWLLRMENSTKPYYYPGELFKTLRETALNSI